MQFIGAGATIRGCFLEEAPPKPEPRRAQHGSRPARTQTWLFPVEGRSPPNAEAGSTARPAGGRKRRHAQIQGQSPRTPWALGAGRPGGRWRSAARAAALRRGFSAGQRRLPHVSTVLPGGSAYTPSVSAFFILRKSPLLLKRDPTLCGQEPLRRLQSEPPRRGAEDAAGLGGSKGRRTGRGAGGPWVLNCVLEIETRWSCGEGRPFKA